MKLFSRLMPIVLCGLLLMPSRTAVAQAATVDVAELEAALDDLMTEVLETQSIPGAVIGVVQGDDIVLLKGYGYADPVEEIPADASESIFRIASITKTFTATAVMQLVEEGRVDLNADVNTYLDADMQFPETFDQPITVADLLTHTSGIDENNIENYPPDQTPSIAELLSSEQPTRLYPPGEVFNYSNFGYSILGHIAASLSGMSYAQYIENQILSPLEMDNTYVEHVLPDSAVGQRAYAFIESEDGWHRVPGLSFPHRPAGVMYSTAEDMTHYMIAHLNDGVYGDTRILDADTVALMHTQQYAAGTEADGWTYGLTEDTIMGVPTIGHYGDTEGFTSMMLLVPDEDFGLFVSFNGYPDFFGAGDPRDLVKDRVIGQFFADANAPAPEYREDVDLSQYEGVYTYTRYIHEGGDRPLNPTVLMVQLRVQDTGDGALTVTYPSNAFPPSQWKAVDEHVFANVQDPGERLVYLPATDHAPDRLLTNYFTPSMFERAAWYEVSGVHYLLFLYMFALTALFPLSLGITRGVQRIRGQHPEMSQLHRVALWVGLVASVCVAIVVGIWTPTSLSYGATIDGMIRLPALLILPVVLALVAGIAMIGFMVVLWQKSLDTIFVRVMYTLATLSVWLFLWLVRYWDIVVL